MLSFGVGFLQRTIDVSSFFYLIFVPYLMFSYDSALWVYLIFPFLFLNAIFIKFIYKINDLIL